jgi:hypothetical protein
MTGYGKGQVNSDLGELLIEIKTVNSRYLEFNFKSDGISPLLEELVKRELKKVLYRGKVSVRIKFISDNSKNIKLSVNEALLNSYIEIFNDIKRNKLKSNEFVNISELLKVPEPWIEVTFDKTDEEKLQIMVKDALSQAIPLLLEMRKVEGYNLKNDLLKRVEFIKKKLSYIKERQYSLNDQYREKLRTKINEFIEENSFKADENRILQEVVIYSDKTDYTEEVTRFESHVIQLLESLDNKGPLGRQLDFLIQEINREINTIASKTDQIDVTNCVIIIKTELEKIREQIQNIE